jgi:hypothetical protein
MIMVMIASFAVRVVMVMARVIMPVMGMMVLVVVTMIVVVMAVPVMGVRRGAEIRAALGVEWRFDLGRLGAESAYHLLDHVIATDAQPFGHDLHRQMPIAEVPGNLHEVHGVAATDLEQWLRGRDHLDQPPVFQHQRIAAAQCDHVGEVEQKLQAAGAGHRHAPPMAVVEFEHDRIRGRVMPRLSSLDGCGAQHR